MSTSAAPATSSSSTNPSTTRRFGPRAVCSGNGDTRMNEIIVRKPDVSALAARSLEILPRAEAVVVETVEHHADALVLIRDLHSLEKEIIDHYEPPRRALDTAKKELLAARDALVDPVAKARAFVGIKCTEFEQEQRRIAAEEQARREAEARKAAEERQLLEAAEAEIAGESEEAEEILSEPIQFPAVKVTPDLAAVQGVSARTNWRAEV